MFFISGFTFPALCLKSYSTSLKWSTMELFSDLILLSIANDQSWKDSRRKHWELTPWWSMWNVSILKNSNKYVVTCLRENNNFLSFYNLVTVKAKHILENNSTYFAKLAVIHCFNYVFLWSLTMLIWSKGLYLG